MFDSKQKIILASVFVLFFAFLFIQQAFAQCILENITSSCTETEAQTGITIQSSFIADVVNQPGVNFNLLNKVIVDDNSFIIQGTDKIEFILDAIDMGNPGITRITRSGLINITFSATNLIDYKYILIDKPLLNPPNLETNSVDNITLSAVNGAIRGEDISNVPAWGKLGNGGNVTIEASVVQVGNINTSGLWGEWRRCKHFRRVYYYW